MIQGGASREKEFMRLAEIFVATRARPATNSAPMNATIRVIDPDDAPLCVERIFVDASGELRASVSGVECSLGTKPALVEAGLVLIHPLDEQQARLRSVFTRLNVSKFANQFWCVAADQRLVNAAQRFNILRARGLVVPQHEMWPALAAE